MKSTAVRVELLQKEPKWTRNQSKINYSEDTPKSCINYAANESIINTFEN